MSSSPASIKGPVKYGELIVLGYNGLLSNGDEARTKSPFALYKRPKASGVKPSTIHMGDPQAISKDKDQFCTVYVNQVNTVVVEYAPDKSTDMLQIGRSTESPIDFVVTDTVPMSVKDTISRFACRIICQRSSPYAARIYGGAFDSSKNIFLGEKAVIWETGEDGQRDGLTTNGVLVMHPLHGFTQDSKPGLWREISVCGDTYTLRETQQLQGKKVSVQVHNESQELVDGSLIYLCGVTLMWRTAEGLARMPTIEHLEVLCQEPSAGNSVGFNGIQETQALDAKQPWAYLQCGHVLDREAEVEAEVQKRKCPMCRVRGPYVPLQLGCEKRFHLDAALSTHAFVPCGHVCSEKTATFWSHMTLPHETGSFHADCPFCVQKLTGDTGYIRLIFPA